MINLKYSHSELSEINKNLFQKLIDDEIYENALRSSSFFDFWDMKICGYALLVTIKTRACIFGDNGSKKYKFIVDERRFNFCEMDFDPEELKRFIHIKNRRREKRGIKTMYNCHPVKFYGVAKKETFVKWN